MKTLSIVALFLSFSLYAQNQVPKQSDLLKRGILNFFIDLPDSVISNYLKFYKLDLYSNYVRMHERNPNKSPWSVFLGIQDRRQPVSEHSFTFVNAEYDFEDVAITEFGVCSSVSYSSRRFNMLAHFDKNNEAKQRVPDRTKNFEAWVKFYKKKIDKIYQLRPEVFPYYENLYELSSEPELKLYIKKHILNLWVQKNVSVRGLLQFITVKEEPNLKKMKKLHEQISARLARGYNPIVFMSQPRAKLIGPVGGDSDESFDHWIHVVQVYKLTPLKADGTFDFYVWDINEELIEYAKKKVEVRANGEVHWPEIEEEKGYLKLSAVKLFPQDDREIAAILRNKAWWCHRNPKFKKYCYK